MKTVSNKSPENNISTEIDYRVITATSILNSQPTVLPKAIPLPALNGISPAWSRQINDRPVAAPLHSSMLKLRVAVDRTRHNNLPILWHSVFVLYVQLHIM